MSLEAAIFYRLSNDAGVSAIVGNRIYPGMSPEGVFPFIAYQTALQRGEGLNPPPLTPYTVTVSCEALDATNALNLRNAVISAMDRQEWNSDNTTVRSCIVDDSDESAFSEDGNPERIYNTEEVIFNVLTEDGS